MDQAAHLRGPYDIINIGKLLQLSQAQVSCVMFAIIYIFGNHSALQMIQINRVTKQFMVRGEKYCNMQYHVVEDIILSH